MFCSQRSAKDRTRTTRMTRIFANFEMNGIKEKTCECLKDLTGLEPRIMIYLINHRGTRRVYTGGHGVHLVAKRTLFYRESFIREKAFNHWEL